MNSFSQPNISSDIENIRDRTSSFEEDLEQAFDDPRSAELQQKNLRPLKNRLRFTLLSRDLEDYSPLLSMNSLSILNIEDGSGHIAGLCAQLGHQVLLCNSDSKKLEQAASTLSLNKFQGSIDFLQADFLSAGYDFTGQFDLVIMHHVAEWLPQPEAAIIKACRSTKPGGVLSLLVFNKDRYLLSCGMNGQLIDASPPMYDKDLSPPSPQSPADLRDILCHIPGLILLQSGIRIFQGFFPDSQRNSVNSEKWITQERLYYRQEPFASLGEHTHILWQRET